MLFQPGRTGLYAGLIDLRSHVRLPVPTSSTVENQLHKVISDQLDLSDRVKLREKSGRQLLELWAGDAPRGTLFLRGGENPSIRWKAATPDAVQGEVSLSPRSLSIPFVLGLGALEGLRTGWEGPGQTSPPGWDRLGETITPGILNFTAQLSQENGPSDKVLYRVSESVTLDPELADLIATMSGRASLELPTSEAATLGMVANTGEATLSRAYDQVVRGAPVPTLLKSVVGWDRLQPEAA